MAIGQIVNLLQVLAQQTGDQTTTGLWVAVIRRVVKFNKKIGSKYIAHSKKVLVDTDFSYIYVGVVRSTDTNENTNTNTEEYE